MPGFVNHPCVGHIFRGNVLNVVRGAGVPYEPLPESLQRIMEDLDYQILLGWTKMVRSTLSLDTEVRSSEMDHSPCSFVPTHLGLSRRG
jgi:hypothetical protein